MVEDSFGRVKPRPGRNVHAGYVNDDDVWLQAFSMTLCFSSLASGLTYKHRRMLSPSDESTTH